MKTHLLFILLLLYCISNSFSQQLIGYAGTGNEVAFTCVIPKGDHYLIGGRQDNYVLLLEVDSQGNSISSFKCEVVDLLAPPRIDHMLFDSDGYLVILGNRIFGQDNYYPFMIKVNYATGAIMWQWSYDNNLSLFMDMVEKNAGGDYFICGQNDEQDAFLAKVDRNTGTITPVVDMTVMSNSETFYAMIQSGNNFYTSSRLNFAGGGGDKMRACLTKVANGLPTFCKSYLRDGYTENARLYATDLIEFKNKIVMLTHGDRSGTNVNKDLLITRTPKSGAGVITNRRYNLQNYSSDGRWYSIQTDGESLYTLGGLYKGSQTDLAGNFFLLKLNQDGSVVYAKSYPFESDDMIGGNQQLLVTGQKVIVVGKMFNSSTQKTEGAIMITSSATGDLNDCDTDEPVKVLTEQVTVSIPELHPVSHNDHSAAISINPLPTTLSYDKQCQVPGYGKDGAEEWGNSGIETKIYPNPSDHEFTLLLNEQSDIVITDMQGRVVQQFLSMNGDLVFGRDLSEGIYLVEISSCLERKRKRSGLSGNRISHPVVQIYLSSSAAIQAKEMLFETLLLTGAHRGLRRYLSIAPL